jgi:hypothetical protein
MWPLGLAGVAVVVGDTAQASYRRTSKVTVSIIMRKRDVTMPIP